jgi:IS5 family transposase
VDADNPGVQIIHRGKTKSLSEHEKKLLKRRQAIEPLIGHTKVDHRMDRCWLQGALGDALHALSCAAGYNIRWLLRAITRLGLAAAFYALLAVLAQRMGLMVAMLAAPMSVVPTLRMPRPSRSAFMPTRLAAAG